MAEAAPIATVKGRPAVTFDSTAGDGGDALEAADKSPRPGLLRRASNAMMNIFPGWLTKSGQTEIPSAEHTPTRGNSHTSFFSVDEDPISRDESSREVIVQQGGIRPGMQRTTFKSEQHGFCLHVQEGSVPEDQTSGPITVTPLMGSFELDGEHMEGILEVHCLPAKCQFDPPLLFDFPAGSGNKDDPIIDEYGRIGYEVLTKDCSSNKWIRDPQHSTALEIVKDDNGKIYVRAQVHHFCLWSLFKKEHRKLDLGNETYKQELIPRQQQKRHRSVIKNETEGSISIQVYVMRMSQWQAAMNSGKVGAGIKGFEALFEFAGGFRKQVHAAAMLPQMVALPKGGSHWFEVPRVGTGFWNSRKAVVAIFTTDPDGGVGMNNMRLEVTLHVRCKTMVTVKLPVENGKVAVPPVASGEGGIPSLLMRVLHNHWNATPGGSPSSTDKALASRSHNSGAVSTTSMSSGPASAGEGTGGLSDGAPEAFATGSDTTVFTGVSAATNDRSDTAGQA